MMIRIGIIGKTNTGKTTFFNAATLLSAEVSTYPFTTKQPNVGKAYVRTICVCRELGVKDEPRNSTCIDGWRFIPVELADLPGLIKGSWAGKGLGNQFLSVASQADALIHIVDASGSVDAEGRLTKPGMGNPVMDIYDIEEEIVSWFAKSIQRSLKRVARRVEAGGSLDDSLLRALAGLKVRLEHIERALEYSGLEGKGVKRWSEKDVRAFAKEIRRLSKPTVIIANKMDIAKASENYVRIVEEFKDSFVVPACSEAELALRRAEERGFIKYVPGEEKFKVLDEAKLTNEQKWALNYVQERVFARWVNTGVQFAINMVVFKLLGMNAVYPVEDPKRLSDHAGRILPDVFLIPYTATVRDLAQEIHSELAKTILYGVDARTGLRLPTDYVLKDRDVISIVSAARKK
ncbi:redox-regulated ATPase YchF [Candidatus Bathyarchaeota archaeon]|nr:redox-regulated ATPase YchF [Candidatus Bathyarchaeota archaeon]